MRMTARIKELSVLVYFSPEEVKKTKRVEKEATVKAGEYAEAKTIVDAVEAAVGVLKAAILMIKWRR